MKKRKNKTPDNAAKAKLLGASGRHMTYKDIKRKAIALGMPFPDAVAADVPRLLSFIDKTNNKPDTSLIDKFDNYIDNHLISIGYDKNDPLMSSKLRLGYLGEEDPESGERRRKRVRGLKKQKERKPRERDENNLIKGTKKSYTTELTLKGMDLERVKRRVLKKFPDANEKSIRLWYSAAKRKQKAQGK